MTDQTTKALLFAIALGLWLHVAQDFARPVPVHAQTLSDMLRQDEVVTVLKEINKDTSALKFSAANISQDTISMKISLSAIAQRR